MPNEATSWEQAPAPVPESAGPNGPFEQPVIPARWEHHAGDPPGLLTWTGEDATHLTALAEPVLATGPGNRAELSATFVCRRQPDAEGDELRALVDYATVSLGVRVLPTPESPTSSDVDSTTLLAAPRPVGRASLVEVAQTLLTSESEVHFDTFRISGTLQDEAARSFLDALRGGPSPLAVRVELRWAQGPSGVTRQWRTDLARVSDFLAERADESGQFYESEIQLYLPLMVQEGVIEVAADAGGPDREFPLLDRFLASISSVLRPRDTPASGPMGHSLAFTPWNAGSMTVTFRSTAGALAPPPLTLSAALSELLAGTSGAFLDEAHTHFVAHDGRGGLAPLHTRVRDRAARSSRAQPDMILKGNKLVSLSAAVRPAVQSAVRPELAALTQAQLTHMGPLTVTVPSAAESPRPLPVITGSAAPPWRDRVASSRRWYPAAFALSDGPNDAVAFRFKRAGHDRQGRTGLDGRVTVRLQRTLPGELVEAAASMAPNVKLQPVHEKNLTAVLEVPFRDEHGETLREGFVAKSLAWQGDDLVLSFEFADEWARIAYGSLAYEGFQSLPARLIVRYQYDCYTVRRSSTPLVLAAGGKSFGLTATQVVARRSRDTGTEELHLSDGSTLTPRAARPALRPAALELAKRPSTLTQASAVQIRPTVQLSAATLAMLGSTEHVLTTRSAEHVQNLVYPCASHERAYGEEHEDGSTSVIGCSPASLLGETPNRIYEDVPLPSSLVHLGRVLRVLTTPGRFVLAPERFSITRFGPADGDQAGRACVLLFSTVDADDLEKSRCVITATLATDVSSADVVRLTDHLRREVDAEAVVEPILGRDHETEIHWGLPTGPNSPLELAIESVETPTGFEVSVSTDGFGLPQIAEMMRTGAIGGSATLRLSDGKPVRSSLCLDLGRICGPHPHGPVEVFQDAGRVGLRNLLNASVEVTELLRLGDDGQIAEHRALSVALPPAGTAHVAVDVGDWVADARVPTSAEIPEIRSFAEDVTVHVMFLCQVPLTEGVQLHLEACVRGVQGTKTITFVEGKATAEGGFVLPLTVLLSDITLELSARLEDRGAERLGSAIWSLERDGYFVNLTEQLFGFV